jgi:hypothetical protein
MQFIESLFGSGVVFQCVGRVQFLRHTGFVFIRQVV